MPSDATAPIELIIDRAHAKLLARGAHSSFEVYEDGRYRWLQSRDGTLHSLMDRRAPERLVLPYTSAMMAGLLFLDDPCCALMLGLGGASQARFLRRHYPGMRITAWESDAEVVDMARRYFDLDDADGALRIVNRDVRAGVHADLRADVGANAPAADLALLDLFGADGPPGWLRGPEVYALCRRLLAPHGVLAANLWADDDDELLGVLDGVQAAFERRTLVLCVPDYRNIVVLAFASRPPLDFERLGRRAASLTARTGLDCAALIESLRQSNYTDDSGFVL